MNEIYVTGGSKTKRKLAEDCVLFAIKELMPRMRTLDIEVNLTLPDNADGYCLAEDKRTFELEISRVLDGDDFITCVLHEMVHVWQIAQGRLAVDHEANYTNTDEYLALWYEKEAYELQEILLQKMKKTVALS